MAGVLYVFLGVVAGVFSGVFGIGGGVIVIPALTLLFGFTQHQAQGTTLALMVPPIGLFAAMRYYQAGNVNLAVAAFVCAGFFVGGFIGAHIAQNLSDPLLRKLFGCLLLFFSLHMIFAR